MMTSPDSSLVNVSKKEKNGVTILNMPSVEPVQQAIMYIHVRTYNQDNLDTVYVRTH